MNEEYDDLIYYMIRETRELEIEIISLRYVISTCMSDPYCKDCMRSDICSSTTPEFTDREDYKEFVQAHLNGKDPFRTRAYSRRKNKAVHGCIDTCHNHPNLYLEPLNDHLQVKDGYITDIN